MIYVECKPDEILVRTLTGLPRREVIHELKGKSRVADRVNRGRNSRGMVDEDPGVAQPVYFRSMTILENRPETGLRLLQDAARDNQIVMLCPKLEDWIVRAAREADTDLANYNLPTDPRELHGVINERLSSFQRLVEDLTSTPRLRALAGLLRG